jgi:hypothetical protein
VRRRSTTTADGQGCQRQLAVDAQEKQLRQLNTDACVAIGFDRAAAEKLSPPTLAFHFGLVEHGYEVHMFDEGKYVGAVCHDFSGNHKVDDLKESLVDAIEKAFKEWRAEL